MKTIAIVCLCMFMLFAIIEVQSQVAINTSGADPHPSSLLDVSGNEGGMLIPRMKEYYRDLIPNPDEGLMIYQIDGTHGFYYFDGIGWVLINETLSTPWILQNDSIFRIVGTDTIVSIYDDKVGIGTTDPAYLLDVEGGDIHTDSDIMADGDIRTDGNIYMDGIFNVSYGTESCDNQIYTSSYGFDIMNFQSSDIRFGTSTTDCSASTRMIIKNSGNVGIGIAEPAYLLDVEGGDIHTDGNIRADGNIYMDGILNVSYGTESCDNQIYTSSYGFDMMNFQSSDIRFGTSTTDCSASTRMIIKNSGNVGIGITEPAYLLDVEGGDIHTDSDIMADGDIRADGNIYMDGIFNVSYGTESCDNQIYTSSYGFDMMNFQSSDIRFGTGTTDCSASTRMIIKNSGNVGIGITEPAYLLDVEGGDIHTDSDIMADGDIRADGNIYMDGILNVSYGTESCDNQIYTSSYGFDIMNFQSSDIRFGTSTSDCSASTRMIIKNSGNVGIGTTDPLRILHVDNVIRLEPTNTTPASASMGDMIIWEPDGKLYVYDGSTWQSCW